MLEIKKNKDNVCMGRYSYQVLQSQFSSYRGMGINVCSGMKIQGCLFIIYKIKVIVNMLGSKCLTMEGYGGAEANLHAFLTNVLVD